MGTNCNSDNKSWNLKKTICLLITLTTQVALLILLANGKIYDAIKESLQAFIVVNAIMLGNVLFSRVLCLIAEYRISSIISAIINAILGIYIFIISVTSQNGVAMTVFAFLFFGFIEFAIVYVGFRLSNLFRKNTLVVSSRGIRIYSGYSDDVAYRIEGDRIYSGYGYDVAYRIDGNRIYSGYGDDVAFRIDY